MNELKQIKIAISSLPKNGWWNNGIIAYHDNDMMSDGAVPNQELLKKEHKNLIDKLHEHSLRTISIACLLYTSPSPRDLAVSRMPSSA